MSHDLLVQMAYCHTLSCFGLFLPALLLMLMYTNMNPFLGRIQKFVEGGSDKYPPKVAHPRGPRSGGMLPGKKKIKIWVNGEVISSVLKGNCRLSAFEISSF